MKSCGSFSGFCSGLELSDGVPPGDLQKKKKEKVEKIDKHFDTYIVLFLLLFFVVLLL